MDPSNAVTTTTGFSSFLTPATSSIADIVAVGSSVRNNNNNNNNNIARGAKTASDSPELDAREGAIASKGVKLPEEFVAAVTVQSERMSDMPEGEDGWRAYYEHPLTAATTAMLNINGAADEQASGIGLLYEYYKLPPLEKVATSTPSPNDKIPDKYVALPDIWSAVKSGRDALPPGDVELYLTTSIKREPEDLTSARKSPVKEPKVLLNGTSVIHSADQDGPSTVHIKQEPPDSPLQEPNTRSPGTPVTAASDAPVEPSTSPRDMSGSVQPFPTQVFANISGTSYDHVAAQYAGLSAAQPQFTTGVRSNAVATTAAAAANVYGTGEYYTDFYPSRETFNGTRQPPPPPQQSSPYPDSQDNTAFVERYIRHGNNSYKGSLTVDLPSPDSGIGEAAITPRDSAGLPQIFDYSELPQSQILATEATRTTTAAPSTRRPWHDFNRNADADKIQIAKVFSTVGFRYYLESPISTSQRREDDRITYINKGQFYGITLEYLPDAEKPLKSQTVKSMIMLVFREEKSPEEEIKAWQFWHSRQHSVKQRILDADTKNSSGLAGCIEEVAHNTIAVYWNPMESSAKINVAVQCLSTDFSNQKGVKGLPLHLQIDTYDDVRDPNAVPLHRGYCQIKVFCDKGAERKTRDEERRAAKRKLSTPGRKKTDELYHPPCDRSEFYSMSDLLKPPVLFTPTGDMDKMTSMELNFYSPEDTTTGLEKKLEPVETPVESVFAAPPMKRTKLSPPSERVMLYVRRDDDDVYNALHLVPPTLGGLASAIENKYKLSATSVRNLYKRSRKGITVKMDDEMIRHYCNEDTFIIDVKKMEDDEGYDVTLTEL